METQAYWDVLINRSVSRFFLLAALAQEPMHGYQLSIAVEEATDACCKPSAATVYPALKQLLEGGYIACEVESTGARERKVCRLTAKGHQLYRTAASSWKRILPSLQHAADTAFQPQEEEAAIS